MTRMILLLGLLATVGCSTSRSPATQVAQVIETDHTDEAVAVEVIIDLANPNRIALNLQTVDYAVTLQELGRFEGEWDARLTLPANDSMRLRIPASVRLNPEEAAAVEMAELPYAVSGELSYNDPESLLEILFDSDFLRPEVSFSGKGVVGKS